MLSSSHSEADVPITIDETSDGGGEVAFFSPDVLSTVPYYKHNNKSDACLMNWKPDQVRRIIKSGSHFVYSRNIWLNNKTTHINQ